MASDEDIVLLFDRLPRLSYYQILSLPHRYATSAEVKRAFHEFALNFHPDLFMDATEPARIAAKESFKRAVEAYEVLRDATMQRRYVENYLKKGTLRLPPAEFSRRSIPPPPDPIAAPRKGSAPPPAALRPQPLPGMPNMSRTQTAPSGALPSPPAPRSSQPMRPRTWVDDVETDDGKEIAERVERMVQEGRWQDALQHISLLETLEPQNLAVKTKRNAIKRRFDRGK